MKNGFDEERTGSIAFRWRVSAMGSEYGCTSASPWISLR